MADYNLGTARGEVVIDYDGKGGVTKANADLETLRRNSGQAGAVVGRMGVVMAAAGVAIAAGIGGAVAAAVNFEKQLSGIKAVTGATAADMELVRKKALQLGKDTKFSASEAALAMEELAKAGVSLPDIMNGAADATVALAAAGEIELPRAAEIAANAMNVFKLRAEDLPRVADTIAGAANASAISVGEYAESMKQAGAAAALAGVSFEDMTTAIALMGNAGIKGSDAGTSLKTMLLNLNPSTKKQIALFKELGIVTKNGSNQFFDAKGNAKSLSDIAGILSKSLEGMTRQQKLAALETMFGSDAIRAAAILADQGAAGFDKMAASIGKVSAADVAKTRMDNLAGSVEQLKGSLETAAIVMGTILLPVLRQIVDGVTGVFNAFLELSPGVQSAVLAIAGAAAAFLTILGVGLKVVAVLRAIQVAALLGFGPFLIVGAIIASVIALAAAIFILYKRFEPVRNVVNAVGNALRTAFLTALPYLQAFGNFLVTQVLPVLIRVGQFLLTTFGPIFVQVGQQIASFVQGIIGYFRSILPQLTAIFNALRAVWNAVWPPLFVVVRFIFTQILSFVMSTLRLLATGIGILLNGIAGIFRGVFNIIGGIVRVFLSVLTGNWRQAWEGVKQIVRGVLQVIVGIIKVIIGGTIIAICVSSLKVIGSAFRAGFNAIRGVVTGAVNAIRAVFTAGMNAIRAVGAAVTRAVTAYFSAWRSIIGVVRGIFSAVLGAIRSALAPAVGVVRNVLSQMIGAVTSIGSRMFSAGAQIISQLVSGIMSKIGSAVSAVKNAIGAVTSLLPGSPVKEGPLRVLNNGYAGKQIINMLSSGILAARGLARSRAALVVASVNDELAALARTQAFGVNASVGVSSAMAASSVRAGGVRPAAGLSGASDGRTVVYDVDVHNPPPVSGERQVTEALRRIETLYQPFQGVPVG